MNNNILDNYKIESKDELFDVLFKNDNVIIERIISYGNITPDGEWYDQSKDEWVILLEGNAKIVFEDNSIIELNKGDYLHLPAHKKHRVSYTSIEPNCIWLAFHFKSV
jgi:cupin 2 domain-containing protein